MSMFEEWGKKLSETGKAVGDKTKQVSELAKLNYKIVAEEKAVEELYSVLGKMIYEVEKGNSEFAFYGQCEEISAKLDAIAELKAQVSALKGVCKCQNCGAEVDIANDYCGKCGTKLVKPEPKQEEPAAVEEAADDVEINIVVDKDEPSSEDNTESADTAEE